jgi:MFS family permease
MDIGKKLQESLRFYWHNFGRLLLATLIVAILSGITLGILAGPLIGGLLVFSLKLLRGEKGDFQEIFGYFGQFGSTFLVTLCLWAVMIVITLIGWVPVIGWLFSLAVGPAASILYIIAIGLVVIEKKTVQEALRQAIDCCKAEPLLVWLYAFISGILAGLGGLLFGIGAVFTMPFGVAALVVAYQELTSKTTSV